MTDLGAIQLLTIAEVAKALAVSKSWVYQAIRDGVLPAAQIGTRLRVREIAVRAYIDSQRVRPVGERPPPDPVSPHEHRDRVLREFRARRRQIG